MYGLRTFLLALLIGLGGAALGLAQNTPSVTSIERHMPVDETTDADEVTWRVIIKTFAPIKHTASGSSSSTSSLNTVRNAVQVTGRPKGSKVEVSFVERSAVGTGGVRTITYDVKVSESKEGSLDQFEGR